ADAAGAEPGRALVGASALAAEALLGQAGAAPAVVPAHAVGVAAAARLARGGAADVRRALLRAVAHAGARPVAGVGVLLHAGRARRCLAHGPGGPQRAGPGAVARAVGAAGRGRGRPALVVRIGAALDVPTGAVDPAPLLGGRARLAGPRAGGVA